ncbi:tRNA (guanine(26)-N(2))-dimethyltransferase, mitochondrial [Pseudocercospora fuligena]|uniref:tRNA (guanine(26)-N(2))-dimethyltransferase n=1 Tax=Pseudocercospora fuligena TaxID=685502 RepID=A0A8H6VJ67_9PEZI|nr:tRNA (guanine(26)-N(2))-dimethyltransferase, mitochondrial [Pseudocercospora fuligena]
MASQTAVPITTKPATGQIIEHEGKTYETIREGQAYILIPPNTQKHVNPQAKAKNDESVQAQSVFYNPIQQFNRDLSVLAIKAFGEDWLQRRKAQTAKTRQRNQDKKARKEQKDGNSKKRKAGDAEATETNGDDAVKRRKSEDGTAVSAAEDAQPAPQDEVSSAVNGADAQEDGAKLPQESASGVDDGSVSREDAGSGQSNGHGATNGQPSKPTGPRFRILDALSATGLRALRYAKEIPFVTAVVGNDMNPNAITSMKMNVEHNELTEKITPNLGDAIGHMYTVAYPPTHTHGPKHVSQKYDVIDLDPYGTAAPFIDAALQAINDGGLLCVTCTDSGVFASLGYCEKTFALYGGMPIKGSHMHEGGLRLIINSVASAAARHGMAIEPLLSLSIDFYARVFIRVRKSPADVKFLAGKTMLVYGCDNGCGAWSTNMIGRNTKQAAKNGTIWYKHTIAQGPGVDRFCEHCGSKSHIAGPMWGGPIHNAAFIQKVLEDLESVDPTVYETRARVEGMLTTALDELSVNEEVTTYVPAHKRREGDEMIPKVPPEAIDSHPFFFNPSALSKVIHCVAPKDAAVRGALRGLGYIATRSHCQPGSIKTDAPWNAIWRVMREWVRQKQPIKEGALKETQAGWKIMNSAQAKDEIITKEEPRSDDASPDIVTESQRRNDGTEPSKKKVIFDEVLGKDTSTKKIVRYQQNPRENWGPMTKAKGSG